MKRMLFSILLLFSTFAVGAVAQDAPLNVVATTTILADVAQNVGGDLVTVNALVPADADAHAFQPTTEDAARIADADLLLAVGLGYEAFLGGLLENAGEGVTLVDASNGVEVLAYGSEGHAHEEGDAHADDDHATEEAHSEDEPHMHGAFEVIGVAGEGLECEAHDHEGEEAATEEAHSDEAHGECDPHVWMDPQNVAQWARNIAAAFAATDPANTDTYAANADAYIAQLEALDAELEAIVAALPEESRVLVTNHEFMRYFAARYGFEIVATVLPGGSTDTELSPQELVAVADVIAAEGVPAIFAEVSANPRIAEVIAEEAGISVVTALYSESLGGEGTPAATYLDFMRYNTQTIVDALAG